MTSSKPSLIVLVGMAGAGKSSCVEHLEKKGWPSVYFGGVVVDETIRRYGKAVQEKEKIVRSELRAKHGMGAIALLMLPKIDELLQTHATVIVDGMYSWDEYKIFKDHYGEQALIVAVAAPRALRHKRLGTRAVRPLTAAEANERDYSEIETLDKGGPIADADYTIVNDTDMQSLLQHLDTVLEQVGAQ